MLSPMFTSLLLTLVVVPETVKLPLITTLPEASIVVNVPAAAVVAPITVPSMLPPLMSAVVSVAESAARLSIFAVPFM